VGGADTFLGAVGCGSQEAKRVATLEAGARAEAPHWGTLPRLGQRVHLRQREPTVGGHPPFRAVPSGALSTKVFAEVGAAAARFTGSVHLT